MTTNLNALASQAFNLFPADRIDLAERLLESVDYFADPQIEDHWRDIGLRRLAVFERGEGQRFFENVISTHETITHETSLSRPI